MKPSTPRRFLPAARWLIAVLILGGALAGPASGHAAVLQQSGLTFSARAGFDGYYKEGQWIPVRLTVANDGPDMSGTLRVSVPRGYGAAETIFTRAVDLPTQSRREIFLYVIPDGVIGNLDVALVNEKNRAVASKSIRMTQITPADLLYGVLAGSSSAFNGLADLDPGNGAAFIAQLEPGDLPPAGRGWKALDVLVISDVDTGALSPEQRAALAGWVAGGGRLVVAGGPSWQKTSAGVADLLPVAPAATRTLTDLSALAAFAAFSPPEGSGVAAEGALTSDAVILVRAGGLPLVVTRRSGFGQVTFLALDPAFAPLKGWDGFGGLFRNILSIPLDRPSWLNGPANWSAAQEAVTALPNLELPATWQVCGFMFVYLIVIGPLNYLVLKQLKRRELAWITIPGIVLVFSSAAYISGYQLSGTRALLHQLTIVQVWPDSDRAQVDVLVGLFSPRRSSYDLEFAPGLLVRPMPNYSGFGGPPTVRVEQGDSSRVPGVNTEVAAVESFVAQGWTAAPQFSSSLTMNVALAGGSATLDGAITNLSDLTLKDVVLLGPGPGSAQRLGQFSPGETMNVSLYLGSSRARPAPPNTISPAALVTVVGSVPPPYYYGGYYDSTLDDVFGTSGGYYYNYGDREQYRRFSLFQSVLDPYNSSGRGNGIYLVGWTSDAPREVSTRVTNRNFSTLDATLYLIALRPEINLESGALTVPPGLMTWALLEASAQGGSPSPYDYYAYTGDRYAIRFAPAQPLVFDSAEELTLRLTSYGMTGIPDLRVELWDFSEYRWSQQVGLVWGENPIPDPARFVGPGGEILVRVENTGFSQVSIENLDFTLVVER
jgi:hypothetical protein